MKNALILALLSFCLTAFFSFADKQDMVASGNETGYRTHTTQFPDTIPARKDTSKWKSKKTPYDSFGKPKTMDSVHIK